MTTPLKPQEKKKKTEIMMLSTLAEASRKRKIP
jgi:hypothetical protein